MTKFYVWAAAAALAVAAPVANAALIGFGGQYTTDDNDMSGGISAGDEVFFNSITVGGSTGTDVISAGDTIGEFDIVLTTGAGNNQVLQFSSAGPTSTGSFAITSTTVATSPGLPGIFYVAGGLGDLTDSSTEVGSWFVLFSNSLLTGSFSGTIETPPGSIPGADVPIPAALPLMAGALGLLGFVRRRKSA